MDGIIQYLVARGLDPASAATLAARMVGAQMRSPMELDGATAPPEFEIGPATVTRPPSGGEQTGRALHAFGFPRHEAARAGGDLAFQDEVGASYIQFLQQRYRMTPDQAKHFAAYSLAPGRRINEMIPRLGDDDIGGFSGVPMAGFQAAYPSEYEAGSSRRADAYRGVRSKPTFGDK